ncbi:MAG TPA: DUF11 domain-containing protein [Chloroflexi bacterium]|nr:DUF11 domain-containing protein [Chloroflexota bacterium]
MRRGYVFVGLVIVVTLLLTPVALFAQSDPTPTPGATPPAPLSIFTTFPAQVIGLNESVSIPLKVRAGTAQTVQLAVEDVPEGWNAFFRGGNRSVSAVFVDGVNDASVDLRVEPAATAAGGVYNLTVVATGEGESSRLPLTLTVEEKAPASITLTTDLPTVRGKPNTSFRFNVTLKNEGSDDLNVSLTADAPQVFLVSFSLNSQDVTAVPLAGGESKRLTVEARAYNTIAAGAYPITINAQAGDAAASLLLTAEVVGQPELTLTTPDGRLSGDANAGAETSYTLVVANPGTAPARNVTVSASAPSGWNTSLEPKDIPELAPGQSVNVTAKVTPNEKAINGDYVVSFTARADDASAKSIDMRITVTTSTLWGIVGVALIAVAVGAVALAVGRFGRR